MLASVLIASASGNAVAWEWVHPLESPAPVQFYPSSAAFDDSGRLWAAGATMSGSVIVRYDDLGAPARVVSSGENAIAPVRRLVAGKNGEMFGLQAYCSIAKYGADGTFRWLQSGVGCLPDAQNERTVWPVDVDGEQWALGSNTAARLGADGRILARIDISTTDGHGAAVDERNGRFFAAFISGSDRSPTVSAFDRRGAALWQWHGNAGATGKLRVGVAGDGSVRVAGLDARGLFVASIDATGSQRWNRNVAPTTALGTIQRLYAPLPDAAGDVWIALESSETAAPAVVKLDVNGDTRFVRSRNDLTQTPAAADYGSAQIAPDGDLLLARRGVLTRISGDGAVRFTRTLAPDGNSERPMEISGVGTDGVVALVLRDNNEVPGEFKRVASDGAVVPPPVAVSGDFRATAARATRPDGSLIVWTQNGSGARELLQLDTAGRVAWRVATQGVWSLDNATAAAELATRGDRICTLDAYVVDAARQRNVLECRLVANGALIWSRTLADTDRQNSDPGKRVFVDIDGAVSAWYASGPSNVGTVEFSRFDKDGTVLATKQWPGFVQSTTPFDGAFTLIRNGNDYVVVDRAGAERYRTNSASINIAGRNTFDAEGGLVSIRASGPTTTVTRLDARGVQQWSRQFPSTQSTPRRTVIGADGVYVVTCCRPFDPTTGTYGYSLTRLAPDTGEPVWTRELDMMPSIDLALTPAGDAVAAVGWLDDRIFIDVVNTSDGSVRTRRTEKCYGNYCSTTTPLIDARSRLHVLDYGDASTSALASWQIPPASARNARLDQPGITGAWWAPYANGEGFVLDYLPASRTLFMPWFTFARQGGNDPAGQRWYVVQGSVAANATSAELPITAATGGAFDAGPPVAPAIVGTATLTFTDCDNGTLRYRFDAAHNGGAAGTITLSRLSPATQDCIRADGTTQVRTTAPVNGFDARMSGSWYEEATAGQGLQFAVQPGGIFFAPWFTYDPAGIANDPGKQHWYTIQGSLADARNGVATLPIVQTIGGAFDSVPTNNMYVVGKAMITLLACDRAKLDYRFDNNELAGPVRARSGGIDLAKAGGCMP